MLLTIGYLILALAILGVIVQFMISRRREFAHIVIRDAPPYLKLNRRLLNDSKVFMNASMMAITETGFPIDSIEKKAAIFSYTFGVLRGAARAQHLDTLTVVDHSPPFFASFFGMNQNDTHTTTRQCAEMMARSQDRYVQTGTLAFLDFSSGRDLYAPARLFEALNEIDDLQNR